MAGRPEKFEPPDMRGEDLLVPLAPQFFADEILQLLPHHRALRRPKNQPRPHRLIDMEQLQLLAQLAVIALARFFHHLAPLGQFLRRGKSDAVNALQLRVALVALVVGAGHRGEGKGPDLARRGHVRARAQIGEGTVAVKADFLAFRNVLQNIQLVTARHPAFPQCSQLAGPSQFHRRSARDHLPLERLVGRNNLLHLGFDLGEILR